MFNYLVLGLHSLGLNFFFLIEAYIIVTQIVTQTGTLRMFHFFTNNG